jgi:hypothetical protein
MTRKDRRFRAFRRRREYDPGVGRRLPVLLPVLLGLGACAAGLPLPQVGAPSVEDVADELLASAAGDAPGDDVQPADAPEGETAGEIGEPTPPVPEGLDADELVELTPDECYAQLDAWSVPYERVTGAPSDIEAPVRFTGAVAGVTWAIPWRVVNHQDVLDCRLAAALAEWAVLLRALDVVEVRLYSFYRRGSRQGAGAEASGRRSQHQVGLAADVRWFVLESGEVLDVLADFRDPGSEELCDGALEDPRAAVLLAAYCGACAARLFHVQLSPLHNREHANHFHLDLAGAGGGRYIH